jgi:RNA polymerase sigma-70 factor (ECF subfamily)
MAYGFKATWPNGASMDANNFFADQFEHERTRLQAVAYRMLGSRPEAEDAVQEAWVRLSRSESAIENLGGWLTTVVARVCLDMLRSRKSRGEQTMDDSDLRGQMDHPEAETMVADSIGPALLVVLETLDPAERVAFVLHDTFDLSFNEIAQILGRSEAATRQLASRARRRVRGVDSAPAADFNRRREVVKAFLAASREGNFAALLALLDPNVVLRADDDAVRTAAANQGHGAPNLQSQVTGANAVAETFRGRARAAQLALIDGLPGAVWAVGGKPRVVFVFDVQSDKVTGIDLVMEPSSVEDFNVELIKD